MADEEGKLRGGEPPRVRQHEFEYGRKGSREVALKGHNPKSIGWGVRTGHSAFGTPA